MEDPQRWQSALFWLLVALGLVVAAVAIPVFLVPRMPPAPELDGIKLVTPGVEHRRADALRKLLAGPGWRASTSERAVLARFRHSQWPEDPRGLLRDERSKVLLFIASMKIPACIQGPFMAFPWMRFAAGMRDAALASVAEVQVGQSDRAAANLAALLDGVRRLTYDCRPDLTTLRALISSAGDLDRAAGFVLADPALSADAANALSRRLVELEMAPPLARAIETNWQEDQDTVARFPVIAGNADYRRLVDRAAKRLLWLSRRPKGGALVRPSAEEIYAEKVARWPAWLARIRLGEGTVGGLPIVDVHLQLGRDQIEAVYAEQCRMAVLRAHWIDALRRRGHAVSPALVSKPPRNPFTGTLISRSDPRSAVCRRDPLTVAVPAWAGPDNLPPPPGTAKEIFDGARISGLRRTMRRGDRW